MPRKARPKLAHKRLPTAYVRPGSYDRADEMVEYAPGFFASRETVARFGLAGEGAHVDAG